MERVGYDYNSVIELLALMLETLGSVQIVQCANRERESKTENLFLKTQHLFVN